MAGFTHDRIIRNAFRILGIPANATQVQVDAALRMMQLYSDPTHIPPTPYDLPYIGPLKRNAITLQDAASRLAQPESRVHERVWWFFIVPPADHAIPAIRPDASIEFRHAVGLLQLSRLLSSKSPKTELDRWKALLESFTALSRSAEFKALLQRAESEGDFDKRAEPYEIDDAVAKMPAAIAGVLIDLAEAAIPGNNFVLVEKIVTLLKGVEAGEESRRILFQRMEDSLTNGCNQAIEDIDIAWRPREVDPLRKGVEMARRVCISTYEPLLHILLRMAAPDDMAEISRVKAPMVKLLNHMAEALEACRDYLAAEAALERALFVAKGTPMRAMIENRLARVKPLADAQRPKPITFNFEKPPGGNSPYAPGGQQPSLNVDTGYRPATRKSPAQKEPRRPRDYRLLAPVGAIVAIYIGAVCMGLFSSNRDRRQVEAPMVPSTLTHVDTAGETERIRRRLRQQTPPVTVIPQLTLDNTPESPDAPATPLKVPDYFSSTDGRRSPTPTMPSVSITPSAPITDLLVPPPPPLPTTTFPSRAVFETP